jgi:hypothetical protein
MKDESAPLYFLPNEALSPDAVDGELAGPYFSLFLVNAGRADLEGLEYSVDIWNPSTGAKQNFAHVLRHGLIPGKPTELVVDVSEYTLIPELQQKWDENEVRVTLAETYGSLSHTFNINRRTFGSAYHFTFLDHDGSVHFCAVLGPKSSCPPRGCPIVFATHGADVVADKSAWTGAYRQQENAYILLPTNRHKYGYDWEGAGFINGKEAMAYFQANLPGVPLDKRSEWRVDTTRRLYAGHSMGGHGCLVYSTHEPDFALAANPASGWIRHELYLPDNMRYDYGYSDHFLRSLLLSSIQEYDADMYAPNLKGIPFLVRMGGADETVPPYLLRRMARIKNEIEGKLDGAGISEVPGQGHWWDEVVYDETIDGFFQRYLTGNVTRPPLPPHFSVTMVSPANMHGRGGVRVLQQRRTHQQSVVDVHTFNDQPWILKTHNVRRFGFYELDGQAFPENGVVVDNVAFDRPQLLPVHYCLLGDEWQVCDNEEWMQEERSPSNYGPARQVMFLLSC